MSTPSSGTSERSVPRRSFLARAAAAVAAVAAGFAAGHAFRIPGVTAQGGLADGPAVSVRPHPHAVPRNNAGTPPHE